MIPATTCKLNSIFNVEKYCTEKIEPLLLKGNGRATFGKYNKDGSQCYYISALYAKDPPSLESLGIPKIHPFDIKIFLESLGYQVNWIMVKEWYPAGYSGTGRTKYYNAGYNIYYTLDISC